jgi:2-polyprenyl-3-methyl-5-hydroxy-6-metoxy-1,4-benzoquinol methylase
MAIEWSRSADEVLSLIQSSADGGLTFFGGFRLRVASAEAVDWPEEGQPGDIVGFADDHPVVQSGKGHVRLDDYVLHVAGETSDDLRVFASAVGIAEPFRLMGRPFASNEDANEWERRVDRWRHPRTWSDAVGEAAPGPAVEPTGHARELIELNEPFFEYLIARTGVPAGGRALDIGCGDGWASWLFRSKGLRVSGIDVLPESIRAVRRLVPDGDFRVADVFDVESIGWTDRFDIAFCRNLGVAQKIVDWDDPRWVAAGASIVGMLRPSGVLFWAQMTNRSERITADGFSNASPDTLLRFFRRFSEPVDMRIYGYTAILVAPRGGGARVRQILAEFDERTRPRSRPAAVAPTTLPEDDAIELVHRTYADIGALYLVDAVDRARGVVIAGVDGFAALAEHVCRTLGIPVAAILDPSADQGIWRNERVLPMKTLSSLVPFAVIDTTPQDRVRVYARVPILRMSVPVNAEERATRTFLLAADADRTFDTSMLPPALAALGTADMLLRDEKGLADPSFEKWSGDVPTKWRVEGAGSQARRVESPLRRHSSAAQITFGTGTASFVQTVALRPPWRRIGLGAWVRTHVAHVARVQMAWPGGVVASAAHPGDGQWRFLSVSVARPTESQRIDVYLQLIASGSAAFDEAVLAVA